MTYSLRDLRAASDDELISRYDVLAKNTTPGTDYYLKELARRDQARATTSMLHFTQAITRLTWVIAGLTVVNVLLTAIAAFT